MAMLNSPFHFSDGYFQPSYLSLEYFHHL
jgi:hypothetical protein